MLNTIGKEAVSPVHHNPLARRLSILILFRSVRSLFFKAPFGFS